MEQFISEHTGEEIDELIGQIPLKQDLPYITEFNWDSLSAVARTGEGEIILSKEFFEAAKARKTIVIPLCRGTQTGIIAVYVFDGTTLTFAASLSSVSVQFRTRVPSDITEPVAVLGNSMACTQMQPELVSGDNIKTINGESVVGRGNLNVGGAYVAEFLLTDLTQSSSVTVTRAFAEAVHSKKPILIPVGKTVDNTLEYIVVTCASGNDPDSNIYIKLEFLYGSTKYFIILSSKEAPETVAFVLVRTTSLTPDTSNFKTINGTSVYGAGEISVPTGIKNVTTGSSHTTVIGGLLELSPGHLSGLTVKSQAFAPSDNRVVPVVYVRNVVTAIKNDITIALGSPRIMNNEEWELLFEVDSDTPVAITLDISMYSISSIRWKNNGISHTSLSRGHYRLRAFIKAFSPKECWAEIDQFS